MWNDDKLPLNKNKSENRIMIGQVIRQSAFKVIHFWGPEFESCFRSVTIFASKIVGVFI